MDNGAPFASVGLGSLSELSVWFIKLGIRPERIEPGHPEPEKPQKRQQCLADFSIADFGAQCAD
jgi:hypothetical protein